MGECEGRCEAALLERATPKAVPPRSSVAPPPAVIAPCPACFARMRCMATLSAHPLGQALTHSMQKEQSRLSVWLAGCTPAHLAALGFSEVCWDMEQQSMLGCHAALNPSSSPAGRVALQAPPRTLPANQIGESRTSGAARVDADAAVCQHGLPAPDALVLGAVACNEGRETAHCVIGCIRKRGLARKPPIMTASWQR